MTGMLHLLQSAPSFLVMPSKLPSHAFLGDDPSLQNDILVVSSLNKIVLREGHSSHLCALLTHAVLQHTFAPWFQVQPVNSFQLVASLPHGLAMRGAGQK